MRYGADGSRTLVGRGTHWQRADDHSELALKIDLIVGRWKANDTVGRKEPMRHTLVHQRLVRPDIGYTERHGGELHVRAKCRAIEIGRASCRERVFQSVSIPVVAGSLKKTT